MLIASRRTGGIVGALTAVVLLLAGCGSGSDTAKPASNDKVTLTVGPFGTFGYKEAGLYDSTSSTPTSPSRKRRGSSRSKNYYQGLQTQLAAGSGLADIQAIEVGQIAEVTPDPGRQVRRTSKDLGANELKGT